MFFDFENELLINTYIIDIHGFKKNNYLQTSGRQLIELTPKLQLII